MYFDSMYPDVLGAITNGTRISIDDLQCAVGVFPETTYINQSCELIVILQSMVDENMQVKVAIQLPTEDKKGNPVVIDTPKKMVSLGLRPGEVGVLRMPMVPHPPTQPGKQLPVRVAVRYRTAKPGRAVRPPAGGAPPSTLDMSSFKVQSLKEVTFSAHTWNQSTDIITTYFDIAPKRMPNIPQDLKPQYETLWTHDAMRVERQLMLNKLQDAHRVAAGLTRSRVYEPFVHAVDERFANRGLPLHPGEVHAIAKIMTYTLDEGLELEPGFRVEDSLWFKTLCQVLAHDESVEDWPRSELAVKYLFESTLFDAIILGFAVIEPKVREDLGTRDERFSFANRVLTWFVGKGEADLSYVYLPLVMAGVVVNQIVSSRDDNPWIMLEELHEAVRGRARLFTGEASVIFDMTSALLREGEESLKRARIPKY